MARRHVSASTDRVRMRFERAIVELAHVQPIDTVTVRSICARSGLGRHTFFQIFSTLDEAKAVARANSAELSQLGRWPTYIR